MGKTSKQSRASDNNNSLSISTTSNAGNGTQSVRGRQNQSHHHFRNVRSGGRTTQPQLSPIRELILFVQEEREGLIWLFLCVAFGILLGVGVGSGYFLPTSHRNNSLWSINVSKRIRKSHFYQALIGKRRLFGDSQSGDAKKQTTSRAPFSESGSSFLTSMFGRSTKHSSSSIMEFSRNHPNIFYMLREMIMREEGGYVHADLGIMMPAPCGALRGLGMLRSSFNICQMSCSQGGVKPPRIVSRDALPSKFNNQTQIRSAPIPGTVIPPTPEGYYTQEEILLRVPISVQITRYTALKTLRKVIPDDVQRRVPLEDLDDFAILTLALAHERGRMRDSMYWPYIASLPVQPSCGYSPALRPQAMETIASLGSFLGLDVSGWPTELLKVYDYSERISKALAKDYGLYLSVPKNVQVVSLLQWALCQVASRAIAARELDLDTGKPIKAIKGKDEDTGRKSLRLVPIVDLINHDVNAGKAQELYNEIEDNAKTPSSYFELEDGRFYTSMKEHEHGTFIVRNIRQGQVVALARDQVKCKSTSIIHSFYGMLLNLQLLLLMLFYLKELLMNYNVPEYSSLDWFITMGFVPPERSGRWVKVESALPQLRLEYTTFEGAST